MPQLAGAIHPRRDNLRISQALVAVAIAIASASWPGTPARAFGQAALTPGATVDVVSTPILAGTRPARDIKGRIALDVAGTPVAKRFVWRFPSTAEAWNGGLVIGAHGGSGGNNYAADGRVIGTDETALDDVVGRHALAAGFAYASVDRDGLGGTREGLQLTNQFTDVTRAALSKRLGRAPARTYLVGLSMGGGIARLASEQVDSRYDGVVIIAGAAGDLPTRLERLAQLAALWPGVDPSRNPDLPARHPRLREYADAIGTPVDGRRLWPYTSRGATPAALRRTLEELGLAGLSDAQLASFRVIDYAAQGDFARRLRTENTTGRVRIPTIEVVGSWDDFVLREIRAYKRKVLTLSAAELPDIGVGQETGGAALSGAAASPHRPRVPAELHRLYIVEGVWHMSGDDDGVQSFQFIAGKMGLDPDVAAAMGEGPSYLPTVREAFDRLVAWSEEGTVPPGDQTVRPGAPLR